MLCKRITSSICVTLTLLTGLTLAASAQAQPVSKDKIIAIVETDVILKSEFDARWQQVQLQLANAPGPKPADPVLKKQLLDQLIIESIQLFMADRSGVRVDDNMLNQALATVAQQNNMSFEQFRQALTQQGIYQATRENIRKQIILENYQNGSVNRRINVTRQEVENYLRSETGKASIAPEYHVAHILIPETTQSSEKQRNELAELLHKELENGADILAMAESGSISGIQISGGDLGWNKPENLPSLFQEVVPTLSIDQTSAPFSSSSGHHLVKLLETRGGAAMNVEQFKVRHILIAPNEIRTWEQADELIHELYERIVNGEDFGDIARQNTDDPNSMVSGGDLDWIDDSMLPAEFMDQVRDTPIDSISEPFRAETGWHIIEVQGQRMEDLSKENMRYQAQRILRDRKYENELQNWLTEIRDTSHIEILDPEFKTDTD